EAVSPHQRGCATTVKDIAARPVGARGMPGRHDAGLLPVAFCRMSFSELRRVAEILGHGRSFGRSTMTNRACWCQTAASGAPSIGGKPLRFTAATETKPFIALRRDIVAFLLVGGHAADIGHEHARLSRDIGADIPRVR